ncbi:MAG: HEAT repeat domain-containing protein [Leptolyngbya sp. IPPAS B-1204]|nr:HEAT repeat domain-containing protein [Elainella sp. C42_A2020_010]RNJ68957.1 MAG: HEAT repeat domain-containing protein [Leptolyngbya sp. IPPAS B-1204]
MSIPPESIQLILETLCELLLNAEDAQIRAKAAESLGRLGLEDAIPILREAILYDSNRQVRLNAIDALVFIAKPKPTPMSESPKNQPSFNINQVGNLNTGDVTIQGDQVGIQHNYAQEQSLKPQQRFKNS